MMYKIKIWFWNNIIDTRLGWKKIILMEKNDIDIDQLISDRAEAYNEGVCECYDY